MIGSLILALGLLFSTVAASHWFEDHYTPVKWMVVHFTATLALAYVLISQIKKREPIEVPSFFFFRWARWLFLFLIFLYTLSLLNRPPVAYHGQILSWSSFINLALCSFFLNKNYSKNFQKILLWNVYLSTGCVLIYGYSQLFGFEFFPSLSHNEFPVSFFGFQNMTAELIGYSVLVQVFIIIHRFSAFSVFFLLITLIYLVPLQCRAVYVSLLPSLLPFFFYHSSFSLKKKIHSMIGLFVLTAIVCFFVYYTSNPIKAGNTQLRFIRWMNTLQMIAANPWGTGPDTYEFSYLPYHSSWKRDFEITERMISKSPHNSYLGFTAENGIFFSFVGAVFIILSFIHSIRFIPTLKHKKPPMISLVFSIFLFTIFEALFAFPLENALPFLITSLTTGIYLAELKKTGKKVNPLYFIPFFISSVFFSFFFFYSKYIEVNKAHEPKSLTLACKTFPVHWRSCLQKVKILLYKRNYFEAERELKVLLKRSPQNFLALRFLINTQLEQKHFHDACQTFSYYDSLFDNESSIHRILSQLCAKFP